MTTDYISLARANRVKALSDLQENKDTTCAVAGYPVYPKADRRDVDAIFVSSRSYDNLFQTAA